MLNRAELSRRIAGALGISLSDAELVLEQILAAMVRALHRGDRVEIRGLGVFGVHEGGADWPESLYGC
jgi:nucleoid DNA-binding protein